MHSDNNSLIEMRSALRHRMQFIRSSLSPSTKEYADALIAAKIEEYIRESSPAVVALYVPLPGEPLLLLFARRWMEQYKCKIVLPVVSVNPIDKILTFHHWHPGMQLVRGIVGVRQPKGSGEPISPDLMVVPLLAFNQDCYRLGYGGGYYDCTLLNYPRDNMLVVGAAYAKQYVTENFAAPWDQALDIVITDEGSFHKPNPPLISSTKLENYDRSISK